MTQRAVTGSDSAPTTPLRFAFIVRVVAVVAGRREASAPGSPRQGTRYE